MVIKFTGIPHDLLKVKDWDRHVEVDLLPDELREDPEARGIIKKHHNRGKDPELALADKLSAGIARFRGKYDYWYRIDGQPFMLKVYGDIKKYTPGERDRLWIEIERIYRENGSSEYSHSEVNEKLASFPQDSRFPLVSLKTHHWMTWALYHQMKGLLEKRTFRLENGKKRPLSLKKKSERYEELRNEELYIIKVSLYLPSLGREGMHRLKNMRTFYQLRNRTTRALFAALRDYSPFPAGDDILIAVLSEELRDEAFEKIERTNLPVDVQVFTYRAEEKEGELVLKEQRKGEWALGTSDSMNYVPEKADWQKALSQSWVAWIQISPPDDLIGSASSFLSVAEEKLARRPREEIEREESDVISPELLFSIADGYREFIDDFKKSFAGESKLPIPPSRLKVVESFERTLFIYGLKKNETSLDVFVRAQQVIEELNLHIDCVLTIAVTRPKHPFWEVLQWLDQKTYLSSLIIMEGDKVRTLTDEDVEDVRKAIPQMGRISKGKLNDYANKAKLLSKEHLKLMIEGDQGAGKIGEKAMKAALELIDSMWKRHGEDELEARKAISMSFKTMADFKRY